MKEWGFLTIGVVERPHGISGKIKVKYFGDASENIQALRKLLLGPAPDDLTQYRVLNIKPFKGLFILSLEGLTLEKAKASVGHYVWVHRDQLPPLEDKEYYWEDLIGLRVLTEGGIDLGIVQSLLPTRAHDVLMCRAGEKEVLIPFLEDIVIHVDVPAGSILVRPPEGLIPD